MPLDVKATRAQFVIENSGNLEDSRQQVPRMDRGVYYSYFFRFEKKKMKIWLYYGKILPYV